MLRSSFAPRLANGRSGTEDMDDRCLTLKLVLSTTFHWAVRGAPTRGVEVRGVA